MIDLEPIKTREQAATEGPWCWIWAGEKSNESCLGIGIDLAGNRLSGQVDDPDDIAEIVFYLGDSDGWADSEFIAHARTDVPALIAEIEDLRDRLASLAREMEQK